MKLNGRTILITGGSAGIGLAFALKFLELGNVVIVTGRRQAALDEVKARYPRLHTIQSDVADPAQIVTLARRLKADFPKLDVLMNNAGVSVYRNLKVPAADLVGLMAEMNINVGGVIGMISAVIDVLTANKGTVINVSSALAFVPLPAAPIYSATKAAIHSYTQSLRFQLEDTGVEVIEIMPPAVKTDMTADLAEGDGVILITTDELVKQSFASLKAGAVEIRPGQAKQLAFMRRLAPDFINGQLWKASRKLVPVGVKATSSRPLEQQAATTA
ncbi:MAG: SDR family NAD(P)-dependent oxidoreductase [Acidobacteriaceae bacterium]